MRKVIPVVVLASGGIDSTALIHRYKAAGEQIKIIHFQHGQPSGRSEYRAVRLVSRRYGLKVKVVRLGFNMFLRGNELLGRNALFVLIASSLSPPPARISLGIHQGPEYYDISPGFVADCQRILDGYFGGTVSLEAPFLNDTKLDIINYCRRGKVPLHLTYSCQMKNSPPCGRCPSCLDRREYLGEK